MLKLKMLQADYGDSFILICGSEKNPRYTLIDGGPEGTYESVLKSELELIRDSDRDHERGLDLLIVSHVDTDHIYGIIELLADIDDQRKNQKQETIQIIGK